jgi:hypothetical protein
LIDEAIVPAARKRTASAAQVRRGSDRDERSIAAA